MGDALFRILSIIAALLILGALVFFGAIIFFIVLGVVAAVAIYQWLRFGRMLPGESAQMYRSYEYNSDKGSFIETEYREVTTEEETDKHP